MIRIFISYRRADSQAITDRIHDRLADAFGDKNVFQDVFDIKYGLDFRKVLQEQVSACDVLLVIIGTTWASIKEFDEETGKETDKPRLFNPDDFVRIEVETGLAHQESTLLIPVLVNGASMPSPKKLPDSIQALTFLNAVTVRNNPYFDEDIARVVARLREYDRDRKRQQAPAGRRLLWIAMAALLFLVVAVAILFFNPFKNQINVTPSATITETENTIPAETATTSETQITDTPPAIPTTTIAPVGGEPINPGTGISTTADTRMSFINVREGPGEEFTDIGDIFDLTEVVFYPATRTQTGWVWLENEQLAGWVNTAFVSFKNSSIFGVNISLNSTASIPESSQLGELGWVRLIYDVSYNPTENTFGNINLDEPYQHYQPILKSYSDAGYKVMLVFTHQIYGEGAGYNWADWQNLDTDTHGRFIDNFAYVAGQIAEQYAGQGIVDAYQIWQEQDSPPNAVAAIPLPAADYANLLTQSILAIRAADPTVTVITGGHVSGPASGAQYARTTLANMPADVRPDGIALHPYGRGTEAGLYADFGLVDEEIEAYRSIMPDKPVWITEWGVLDRQQDDAFDVALYADDVIQHLSATYSSNQLVAAIWFPWAMGTSNGYGLVDQNNQPIEPLYTMFLTSATCPVADGYDSPVGTDEERASDTIWPGEWIDASPFGRLYFIGTPNEAYSPGADLNLPSNADAHAPVYAAANGVVTFAEEVPVWGDIIVIRHDPLFTCAGQILYSRYTGIEDMQVEDGETISRGQQIANIGSGDDDITAHLHFDLSPTDILESEPTDWPGKNQAVLLRNYVDPAEFIRDNRPR